MSASDIARKCAALKEYHAQHVRLEARASTRQRLEERAARSLRAWLLEMLGPKDPVKP